MKATGKLDVNGPLPADFGALFAQSCAKATEVNKINCPAKDVKVSGPAKDVEVNKINCPAKDVEVNIINCPTEGH